jgi:NTP pyrophosphatase (non-canonical NTP hydrolase)
MNEFQAKAMGTAVYPERGGCVLYPLLGLIDEVGEVAEKVADGWDNSAAILGLSELRDDDLPLAVVADVLEIAGLVGLLAGELKKIYRDGDGKFTDEKLKDLAAAFAVLRVSVRSPALDRLWKMPEDSRPPLSLAESRTKFSNKKEIADELGDVQYYVAAVASEFAYTLGEIGRRNNAKLASRQARGVLHGSGDDR